MLFASSLPHVARYLQILWTNVVSSADVCVSKLGNPVSMLCVGSCFLLAMQEDSIEGIYDTLKQCALISKNAGGVGLHVHCIRASGSFIAGVSHSTLYCFGCRFTWLYFAWVIDDAKCIVVTAVCVYLVCLSVPRRMPIAHTTARTRM